MVIAGEFFVFSVTVRDGTRYVSFNKRAICCKINYSFLLLFHPWILLQVQMNVTGEFMAKQSLNIICLTISAKAIELPNFKYGT